jgi:hypothetical protein
MLAAAGYCFKCLGNPALSAGEGTNQILTDEAWKAHVTKCVQILNDNNVAGCPRLWRTKSQKGVLKRRFRLQDIYYVEYTKGTKRNRPDAAAADKMPTATYRRLRRYVNQAGLNPVNALFLII